MDIPEIVEQLILGEMEVGPAIEAALTPSDLAALQAQGKFQRLPSDIKIRGGNTDPIMQAGGGKSSRRGGFKPMGRLAQMQSNAPYKEKPPRKKKQASH